MVSQATQPIQEPEPSADPISERRLAWETLRERDLEGKMGQGGAHATAVKLFVDALLAWLAEKARKAYVAWDVFVEWDPNDPRARVSPDAFILDGQAPTITPSMWQTWEPGCDPPPFALEVVSSRSRTKDYDGSPLRYAALGSEELAIFDPEPHGDDAFPLQVFRRTPRGQFLRLYAGPGPVKSEVLGAWLVVVDEGAHVRLARDAAGAELVPTAEEQVLTESARATAAEEQARVEGARATAAEERASAAEERAALAEARIRQLEEQLAKMR
jgi:Uma2 family endonuclease